MIREGEAGPTAPYSWRLRLPLGLFALAVLGAFATVLNASLAPPRPLGELLRQARESSPAWLAAVAALALLARAALALQARRQSERPPANAPERPCRHPKAARRERLPGPGPSRELLELFARPRPRPNVPAQPLGARAEQETGVHTAGRSDPAATALPMIRLYGPLAIEGDERVCPRDRSVRGLLACLALRRRAVGFDELTDALWPGEDAAKARTRLYKAKQLARAALAEGLERRGGGYVLDLTRVRVDVIEIERIAGASAGLEPLEQALSLSRGEPLGDVDHPFAESERRRLASLRVDLLARVARARLEAGQGRAALDAAEELIARDALNELGWQLAMEAEGSLGLRGAVIDRYGMLVDELDRALGLRPHAGTRTTYLRLLAQA